MLKRYKNNFFEMIEAAGLNIGDFTAREEILKRTRIREFIIHYRPANLTFAVSNAGNDPHVFNSRCTMYAPTVLKPRDKERHLATGDFSVATRMFNEWLTKHVLVSIDEELLPDLWATISAEVIATNSSPNNKMADFTEEERRQIKLALATFRVRLVQRFKPNKAQLQVVSQQLDYLAAAVDRLNKFDWKGVALSTLIGVSTALSLDTERGRQLYGLFQQALSSLLHLIR